MPPDPYVAEAPPPRVRPTDTINSKLDRIIDIVTGGQTGSDSEGTDADGEPIVTFEADPEGLPETPKAEGEETDDGAGTGEGTTNVTESPAARAGFRHPSNKRRVE